MDKKYIMIGVSIWACISGYMGLRVLEGYTEDAVFASLSVMSAQAQEIRYSFLRNDLTIKGIEYDIPDDKVMHKGTIDKVEIKNFHRKIMLVMPQMPPYDADDLPRVAEAITITGITDMLHQGNIRVDRTIGSIQMEGWHQRIGMLLDRYVHDGISEKFYEELYRCRIDAFKAEHVDIKVTTPKLEAPVSLHIGEVTLPAGMQAPRGAEKIRPATVVLRNLTFGHGKMMGSALRVDLRDLLSPEPAPMAALMNMIAPREKGEPPVTASEVMEELRKGYEKRLPFSFASVQGLRVMVPSIKEAVTLNSASWAPALSSGTFRQDIKVQGLHVPAAGFGGLQGVVERFAPDGIHADMESRSESSSSHVSSQASYTLRDLGILEVSSDYSGALGELENVMNFDSEEILENLDLFAEVELNKASLHYKDSGLMALGLAVAAEKTGMAPEIIASLLRDFGQALMKENNPAVQKFGSALAEQLEAPGEVTVDLHPQEKLSVEELVGLLARQPEALPINIVSSKGTRAMSDHLAQ